MAVVMTNLMQAAKAGDIDGVKTHLEVEKGRTNDDGKTALMFAAEGGHLSCVQLLAPHESKKRMCNGVTALMLAARNGHFKCVGVLKAREAGLWNQDGVTALMYAAINGHTICCRILARAEYGRRTQNQHRTALMLAALNCHPECVEILVKYESRIRDKDGENALFKAAEYGSIACVKILLKHELYEKSIKHFTPLILAAKNNKIECIKELLPYEDTICVTLEMEETALMFAAARGHAEAVSLLVHQAGRQNIKGMSALMFAGKYGHDEATEILINEEVGLRDKNGMTALMHAAKTNKLIHGTLSKLARHEINIKDNEGRSVLYYAESKYMRGILLEVAKEMGYKFICNDIPFGSPLDILSKKLPVKDAEQKLKEVDQVVIKEIETALNDAIWSEPIGIDVIKEQLTKFSALFPDIDLTETITEMSTLQYYEECQSCVICLDSNKSIKRVCSNCKSTYVCDNCANVDQIMVSCPTCRGEIGEHDIQFVE